MPIYYHISRGLKSPNLEKKFKKNVCLFFSKKNSSWYCLEKKISKDYGGYIEYKIYIPSSRFTNSFNPRKKNMIVKISKININKYKKILTIEYNNNRNLFIKDMKKKNIIGIDANTDLLYDLGFPFSGPEGFIWSKPNDIKIEQIKCVKL